MQVQPHLTACLTQVQGPEPPQLPHRAGEKETAKSTLRELSLGLVETLKQTLPERRAGESHKSTLAGLCSHVHKAKAAQLQAMIAAQRHPQPSHSCLSPETPREAHSPPAMASAQIDPQASCHHLSPETPSALLPSPQPRNALHPWGPWQAQRQLLFHTSQSGCLAQQLSPQVWSSGEQPTSGVTPCLESSPLQKDSLSQAYVTSTKSMFPTS